jgi:hypothetical protein
VIEHLPIARVKPKFKLQYQKNEINRSISKPVASLFLKYGKH